MNLEFKKENKMVIQEISCVGYKIPAKDICNTLRLLSIKFLLKI